MTNWVNIFWYWFIGFMAIVLLTAAYFIILIEGIMAVLGFIFVPLILGFFICILVGVFSD